MDVTAALAARRTVRAFLAEPVSRPTLEKILGAALRAPSWANTQPWEIWVAAGEPLERLRSTFLEQTERGVPGAPDLPAPQEWPAVYAERTRALTAGRAETEGVAADDEKFRRDFLLANRSFFAAPCVVYLCLERTLSNWSIFDMGMMAQSIMLAAQDHGVDSAIAVNLVIYPGVIRRELAIPEEQLILIGIALGYADTSGSEDAFRSARRSLGEVARLAGV